MDTPLWWTLSRSTQKVAAIWPRSSYLASWPYLVDERLGVGDVVVAGRPVAGGEAVAGGAGVIAGDLAPDTPVSVTYLSLGTWPREEEEEGNSGLRTQDSGLRTWDSGFRTQDSGLRTKYLGLRT